jgi:demethylmenaquinone methyltransferase / 2-methoxy-6-polyprenyl-1,4-benzoquinol methylase
MPSACEIQTMFCRVAGRYDFLNHLLSGGADYGWRRALVKAVRAQNPSALLDLATGSGDVLRAMQRAGMARTYLGMDFCVPMLQVAREKGLRPLVAGDGLRLPLKDESFDAVTIAFGFRNLVDRPAGLREIGRVLRPGGSVYILEFSQPWLLVQPFYFFYLRHVLPQLAQLLGSDREDYVYLADSIRAFPSQHKLGELMREAGFKEVSWRNLSGGLVALHQGRR